MPVIFFSIEPFNIILDNYLWSNISQIVIFTLFRVQGFFLRSSAKVVTALMKLEESPYHQPFWKALVLSPAKLTQSEELSGLEKICFSSGVKTNAGNTTMNPSKWKSWKLSLIGLNLPRSSCNFRLKSSGSIWRPCWRNLQFQPTVSQLNSSVQLSIKSLSVGAERLKKCPSKWTELESLILAPRSISEAKEECPARSVLAAKRPNATNANFVSRLIWKSPVSRESVSSQKFPNVLALLNQSAASKNKYFSYFLIW